MFRYYANFSTIFYLFTSWFLIRCLTDSLICQIWNFIHARAKSNVQPSQSKNHDLLCCSKMHSIQPSVYLVMHIFGLRLYLEMNRKESLEPVETVFGRIPFEKRVELCFLATNTAKILCVQEVVTYFI